MAVSRSLLKAVFATFIVIGLGMGRPDAASGADMAVSDSAPHPAAAAFNWTGCYVGGYAGGATQSREVNAWNPRSLGGAIPAGTFYDPPASTPPLHAVDIGEFNYNLNYNWIGGGTLGCNWQGASPFVFGIEGEAGYLKLSGTQVSPYSLPTGSDTVASTRIGDWSAAVSGRFGYAWDRILVYVKGGLGFSTISSSIIDACSAPPCSPGLLTATGGRSDPYWVAGLGVEYAFANDWSVKGEFLNLGMYKRFEVCGPGAAAAAGSTFCGIHEIEGARTYKVGVNYHFNSPIIARY